MAEYEEGDPTLPPPWWFYTQGSSMFTLGSIVSIRARDGACGGSSGAAADPGSGNGAAVVTAGTGAPPALAAVVVRVLRFDTREEVEVSEAELALCAPAPESLLPRLQDQPARVRMNASYAAHREESGLPSMPLRIHTHAGLYACCFHAGSCGAL